LINLIAFIASIVGLLDSGYLSISKLSSSDLVCSKAIGDCNSVNASQWSYLFGIPIAYLGFAAYLAIIFLILFGNKINFLKPYADYLFFFITLIGFLFSAYLTYIEAAVLKTFCQWCLVSAAMITILFLISVIKLARRQRQ
jgi:uncharacterized membrane protein